MRYIVIDDFGTNVQCWTWKEALEWLACCSGKAAIHSGIWPARRLVTRETVRVY